MPYGGIYFVIREFLMKMAPIIDGYLGLRSKLIGYQYSEISLAMLCNFLCGGDRTEDIYRVHDMIEQKPGLRICSPDTVLRAMTELSVEDIVYTADSGKQYRFNTAERLNGLLVYAAVMSGMLHRHCPSTGLTGRSRGAASSSSASTRASVHSLTASRRAAMTFMYIVPY